MRPGLRSALSLFAAVSLCLTGCGGSTPRVERPIDVPAPVAPPSPTVAVPLQAPRFRLVRVGERHTCALTDGDDVICWGAGDGRVPAKWKLNSGQASPPQGKFRDLGLGTGHTCGLGVDEHIRCWGFVGAKRPADKAGSFDSLMLGIEQCATAGDRPPLSRAPARALLEDAWQVCATGWPPRPMKTVVANGFGTAAVGINGQVVAWGSISDSQLLLPERGRFQYRSVSLGGRYGREICGLRVTGEIDCGFEHGGQLTLAGPFDSVSFGGLLCALKDKRLFCWDIFTRHGPRGGPSPLGPSDLGLPDVAVRQISCSGEQCCALLEGGELRCFSARPDVVGRAPASPPEGQFVDVAAGSIHACAVTAEGRVRCWGDNSAGQCDVPDVLNAQAPELRPASNR